MNTKNRYLAISLCGAFLLAAATPAAAVVDKVICVPWQGDVNKQHTALKNEPPSGATPAQLAVTAAQLKGVVKTTDTSAVYAKWVFGDGTADSAVVTLQGATSYNVETTHNYNAATGTPFTAKLQVSNTSPAQGFVSVIEDPYLLKIEDNTVDARINIAIDRGLWWLFKQGNNIGGYVNHPHTYDGSPHMTWLQTSYVYTLATPTATAIHAFGINGHKVKGNPDQDPYVPAVQYGMNYLLKGYNYNNTNYPALQAVAIGPINRGGGVNDNPEAGQAVPNGYGIQVYDSNSHSPYQSGQIMDAIIASGVLPSEPTGRDFAPGTPKSHIWTYGEVLQDMADMHAWGQSDSTGCNGGVCGSWWYGWNYGFPGDNSASQWGTIGMHPAQEAPWNVIVPPWVKTYNANWLAYSMGCSGPSSAVTSCYYDYFSYNGVGGCAGDNCQQTTTSGMVQMTFDGQTTSDLKWDRGQRRLANQWRSLLHDGSTWGGYRTYGWYSFAKAMRLSLPAPTDQLVKSSGASFDWYYGNPGNATCTNEANCEKGLAPRILETQTTTGANTGAWESGNLTNPPLTTAWMIITLKPTLFQSAPSPCFTIVPNPNYPNQATYFDPSCSSHSETGKTIDNLTKFEWDWDNDGTYDQATSTPDTLARSFECTSLPCVYPVKLRVTDDSSPPRTAVATMNVNISNPPHPPVADAGGPYITSTCGNDTLALSGSESYDPNEGQHEAGCTTCPNDTLTKYEWDLTSPLTFDVINKTGETTTLTAAQIASLLTPGTNTIGLRVTDNTKLAYPGSGQDNLQSSNFGTVDVKNGCICNLTSRIKSGKVQLTWTHMGAPSYDIYRSTTSPTAGFALIKQGLVTTYATYLDTNVVNGGTYYYRVLASTGCGSNFVMAKPTIRMPIDFNAIDNDRDGYSENQGDCNDASSDVHPGAHDILDNNVDEDCDGVLAMSPRNTDDDHDGYTENQGDCDDTTPAILPGATEICNGVDDNCNQQIDEGLLLTFYSDDDGDTFGSPANAVEGCSAPTGYVNNNLDCGPAAPSVHPGAAEVCNGVDDNCNANIDEGVLITFYLDGDNDGFGDGRFTKIACTAPAGYVTDNTECNDSQGFTHPGATEVCDGYDNNCNGVTDEGNALSTFYRDADEDGFGNPASSLMDCSMPTGFTTDNTDCNDTNSANKPGATEQCDGVDNDCDGQIDEDITFSTYYRDADGDGYGDPADSKSDCAPGVGYVSDNTDCDDTKAAIHPGATEVCDGQDNNCDGSIDEGVKNTYYQDLDGDGFGNAAATTQACTVAEGYVADNTDCDDTKLNINPSAAEICDGLDNNCDNQIDEGVTTSFYQDQDVDGYGDPNSATQACIAPAGYVVNNTDCNPTDASIKPGAVEAVGTCDDGIDQNCDGADLSCSSLNEDTDGDGHSKLTDCDDANASINPGAAELCDGIDNNCNGQIDEGDGVKSTFYQDADGDGYGNSAVSTLACTKPDGYAPDSTDCNDSLSNIHPDAYDAPGNGIDEDCSGGDADPSNTPTSMTLNLSKNIVNGGGTTSFFDVFFNIAGDEMAGPNPNCTIASLQQSVGTFPTLAGHTINTANDTRGSFRLTCAVPSAGLSANTDFAVIASAPAGVPSLAGLFSGFANSLGEMNGALDDLHKALQDNDTGVIGGIDSRLQAARNAVDLIEMRNSTAFAPEPNASDPTKGFPFSPAQLAAAGHGPAAADASFAVTLNNMKAKIEEATAFINALDPNALTDATGTQLDQLNASLQTLLSQFRSANPSLHGIVANASMMNELIAITLPNYLHALVNKTHQALQAAGYAMNQMTPAEMYATLSTGGNLLLPADYYGQANPVFFGLIDLAFGSSIQGKLINAMYGEAFKYLENAMIIMTINGFLQDYLNAMSLDTIVTGASLSFHHFNMGGSTIEGNGFNPSPYRNEVWLIGPDAVNAARDIIDVFKDLPSEPEDWHSISDVWNFFKEVRDKIKAAIDAAEGGGAEFEKANQPPDEVFPGCLWDENCQSLYYNEGFKSVYTPQGIHLPSPVIFILHDMDNGSYNMGMFNFFPQ